MPEPPVRFDVVLSWHVPREQADRRSRQRQRRGHGPGQHVAVVAAQEVAERGTERQASVYGHRPVADGLAPPRRRRQVGDHRRRADKERGLAEAGDHAHRDQPPERVHEPVQDRRRCDHRRAPDDQCPPSDGVADPSGVRAKHHRANRERTHRDTDGGVAVPELILDVVRDHRRQHRERKEVTQPARDDEHEPRGQQLCVCFSRHPTSHEAVSGAARRARSELAGSGEALSRAQPASQMSATRQAIAHAFA